MKRKTLTIIAALLLSFFGSFSMLNTAYAQGLSSATWTDYEFRGYDSFYGTNVVAYEAGSNAILYVNVENTYGAMINVSSVGINMHWGDMFNSTQANATDPVVLEPGEYRMFTITFAVPSTSDVTNFIAWDYDIHVEHINATGDVVVFATFGRFGLPYFAIYSADQATCQEIAAVVDMIPSMYWDSARAGILSLKAMNETNLGEYYYMLGHFSDAASHYGTAVDLIDSAFSAEETYAVRIEDLNIMTMEAQLKSAESMANFFNGMSNMWTLFGVALILFALGYIIRGLAALRKAQMPP